LSVWLGVWQSDLAGLEAQTGANGATLSEQNAEHTEGPVRYEVADGVATISLDDPSTKNSLSDAMLDGLIAAFERARDDSDVRCVVLASTDPKTFSSGGNLAGFGSDVPLVHKHAAMARFPRLFVLIGELGKPVVLRAQGHVLAGALGLALACDLIVASDKATFGTPEINVGVFPFMIMALIYRNVGRKKATEMLLLGERMDAAEAHRIGIVNKVVPDADLDSAIADWTKRLASRSPILMKLGKDAIHKQQDMPLEEALEYLRHNLVLAFSTEDMIEGVTAFFEKRDPVWKGQ
jgi:enoyl-CoA hydratase/carnithine racemase